MTENYYAYIYYSEDWVAYYVGKGQRLRLRERHPVPIPDNQHIQIFHFTDEWEAYECEIQLISFWGRLTEGGTLMNVSTGGPGCPGVIPDDETRYRLSQSRKALPNNLEIVSKMLQARRRPIQLVNTITNECHEFPSGQAACETIGCCPASITNLRTGKRKVIKNWRIN